MKRTIKTPLERMTRQQMESRWRAIIAYFHRTSAGDPFGWDWPTMFVLEPALATEAKAIKARAVSLGYCEPPRHERLCRTLEGSPMA